MTHWIHQKEAEPNILKTALKESLFTNKMFWVFTLLVATFFAVNQHLASFDRFLGALFMVLGISHFNIAVRNRINQANVTYEITETHVSINTDYPKKKEKKIPFEEILGYKIDEKDLIFYIKNERELLNKWNLNENITFKNIEIDDNLKTILENKIC